MLIKPTQTGTKQLCGHVQQQHPRLGRLMPPGMSCRDMPEGWQAQLKPCVNMASGGATSNGTRYLYTEGQGLPVSLVCCLGSSLIACTGKMCLRESGDQRWDYIFQLIIILKEEIGTL